MHDPDRTASLMTPAKLAQAPPKAAVSPAAWLDQMAADAGHQHVARVAQLHTALALQLGQRDFAPLAAELQRVAEALARLDFGLLQPRGFIARLAGINRNAGAQFAAQYERIDETLRAMPAQAAAMHAGEASRADRALVELAVEYGAIDKIIDQGSRWLQDMRNQLKSREARSPGDEERRQIAEDALRCEILVARLKTLRAISSSTQQLHAQAQATEHRRSALVQLLQQTFVSDTKIWRGHISPLAAAKREGRSTAAAVDAAMESHRELQLRARQALADCAQLQTHQQAFVRALGALASLVSPPQGGTVAAAA